MTAMNRITGMHQMKMRAVKLTHGIKRDKLARERMA
jgi:hypothetical protein